MALATVSDAQNDIDVTMFGMAVAVRMDCKSDAGRWPSGRREL